MEADCAPSLFEDPAFVEDLIRKGKLIHPTQDEVRRIENVGNCVKRSGWYRASHQLVCSKCKRQYADHPALVGYMWITRICNGDLVKL